MIEHKEYNDSEYVFEFIGEGLYDVYLDGEIIDTCNKETLICNYGMKNSTSENVP